MMRCFVLVFGASKGRCWWFSGIPCVLRTRPLRSAKGRFGGVLCFSLGSRVRGNDGWLAGMTEGLAGMTEGVGG